MLRFEYYYQHYQYLYIKMNIIRMLILLQIDRSELSDWAGSQGATAVADLYTGVGKR